MGSESLHENSDRLTSETLDRHRAIASLMEELEAVDWYQQRVDGTDDEQLKAILAHNRDEEIEHAAMVLEWLRRRVPKFDEELRTYLFTDGAITAVEESATGGGDGGGDAADKPEAGASSLGIGSLKGKGAL